jgi:ribokinase
MEVPAAETAALIHRARAAGGRVILNLAPALPLDPAVLAEIDVLVANRGEAASLRSDLAGLARVLRQALVVTSGAEGAAAFLASGGVIAVPALKIAPVDTTGAGDTFVGGLAAGLDQRLALEPALRRASAAAGLACLAAGAQTAMPDRAAIDSALARLPK